MVDGVLQLDGKTYKLKFAPYGRHHDSSLYAAACVDFQLSPEV